MNLSFSLQAVVIALALLCLALVPLALRRDTGLARRVVRMDQLPRTRWPNWLTRVGLACVLASFACLLMACYYILASASN